MCIIIVSIALLQQHWENKLYHLIFSVLNISLKSFTLPLANNCGIKFQFKRKIVVCGDLCFLGTLLTLVTLTQGNSTNISILRKSRKWHLSRQICILVTFCRLWMAMVFVGSNQIGESLESLVAF